MVPFEPCRFSHELTVIHATSKTKSTQLTSALRCLDRATERVCVLGDRIRREEVVLREKGEACDKLLVQIGQDTTISLQHRKLVAKQRERIAHLKKVSGMIWLYLRPGSL